MGREREDETTNKERKNSFGQRQVGTARHSGEVLKRRTIIHVSRLHTEVSAFSETLF
jgi:hypothetical protein